MEKRGLKGASDVQNEFRKSEREGGLGRWRRSVPRELEGIVLFVLYRLPNNKNKLSAYHLL